jgi:hypothetical protein
MGYGHNPRHPIPNSVDDLEMVLRGGTKFAIVGIPFQRISVRVVPNHFESIFNFIDEFRDNFGGIRPANEEIGRG